MDKETVKVEIAKLIDDFEKNRDYYDKTDEANIETKLIEPMFAALGWTKDDFEKREKVKRKDRRGITDYTFRLHGKSVFVLEAKKVKVDVDWDEETWKQAISYTFSKKVRFSVLTNFKNLLIFCTDDEKAMSPFRVLKYTEYLSSRFDDLWILSKDSFEQNLIFDRATSEGRMKKRRTIDDKLLEDLISSRKKIVESIERNYGAKYTTLEKDDIAQRIFGRLIFIRKCEDKQINFDNDGKEIEMLKEVTALPHNAAYPKLKKIFTKYDDAFNSGLFVKDVDSDVDKIEIDGKVIKELITRTYESKDRNYIYNFEWIDADVLGNIYEQYLGHILKETTKQTRIKESHAHRKEQGIYYTPTDIVKYIVNNTLGEMLKKKRPEEVKKLRVLDPACGSGSFLLKAFDVLEDYYEKNREEKQAKFDSSGDFYSIKEQVLTNNIFGVDLDHKAVEIAQLNLLLKLAEKGHQLPLLQKNIQNGNSLIDDEAIAGDKAFKWEKRFFEIMDEGGFDVVIGNPPYGAELNEQEREYISQKFVFSKSYKNTALVFIERSLDLLKEDGHFGMIVPKSIAFSQLWKPGRELIKGHLVKAVDVSKAFKDVLLEQVIIILNKAVETKSYTLQDMVSGESIIIDKKFIDSTDSIVLHGEKNDFEIFKKIIKSSKYLSEITKTSRGLPFQKYLTKGKTKYPVIKGKTISRYNFKFSDEYLPENIIEQNKAKVKFLQQPKVISQRIVAHVTKPKDHIIIMSTIDKNGSMTVDTVENTVITDKNYSLEFLLCLLNSKLISWYAYRYVFSKAIRTMDLDDYYLGKIPLPGTKIDNHDFISLVNKTLSLHERLNEIGDKKTDVSYRIEEEIKKTDSEIDELVYKLYGITEEEKNTIEESLK